MQAAQRHSADALGLLGLATPQVVDPLLAHAARDLTDETLLVTSSARQALGRLRIAAAVPLLSKIVVTERAQGAFLYPSAIAFARIGTDEALAALAGLGAPDRPLVPDRVSWAAALALVGPPEADMERVLATLVAALESTNKRYARELAADALGLLGARAASARQALRAIVLGEGDVGLYARRSYVRLASPAR